MATERANNLQAFKSFIDEQLAIGNVDLGLDEALARWKNENEAGKGEPEVTSTTNACRPTPVSGSDACKPGWTLCPSGRPAWMTAARASTPVAANELSR